MSPSVDQILASVPLYTDGQDYRLVKLPLGAIMAAAGVLAEIAEPFSTLMVDKDEVTLILPQEAWDDFQKRLPGHTLAPQPYRLVTFDAVLDFTLIGFMARISSALAKAGVSILPLAAFSRDHLLVPSAQFELAWTTLQQLQSAPSS